MENEHTVTYGKLECRESNFKVRQMQGQLPLNTFSGHQSICPQAKIVAACISPDPLSAPPVKTDPAGARQRTEREMWENTGEMKIVSRVSQV